MQIQLESVILALISWLKKSTLRTKWEDEITFFFHLKTTAVAAFVWEGDQSFLSLSFRFLPRYFVDFRHTTVILPQIPSYRRNFADFFDSISPLNGPSDPPGERSGKLKIIENGREVSYLGGKFHQTTKLIDLDRS